MIEYLLRAICGCFIKGMNAFWNTKYKNKKVCDLLFVVFICGSMILREKYFWCISAIYTFVFAGIASVYGTWLTETFCRKEESGKSLLKKFSHKSYIFGLFCGTLMIATSIAFCVPYVEFMLTGEFLPNEYFSFFTPLWYMMLVIFNILWFTYHILIHRVNILLVDVYLNLYTAIISTVSIILNMLNMVSLKEVILILLLMFTWEKYIISVRKYNEEDNK